MEILREWWGLLVGAVSVIFWLSRLEWRGLQNEAEIKRLWQQRKEDLEAAQNARNETNDMLKEIRDDIKNLLKQGHSS